MEFFVGFESLEYQKRSILSRNYTIIREENNWAKGCDHEFYRNSFEFHEFQKIPRNSTWISLNSTISYTFLISKRIPLNFSNSRTHSGHFKFLTEIFQICVIVIFQNGRMSTVLTASIKVSKLMQNSNKSSHELHT